MKSVQFTTLLSRSFKKMTEAEVLQKLDSYKEAILKLKEQRDSYKRELDELKSETSTKNSQFLKEIETQLKNIESALN